MSVERIKSGRRRTHVKQDEDERSRIGHRKRGYVKHFGIGNKLAEPGSLHRNERSSFEVSVCLFVYGLFNNTVNI